MVPHSIREPLNIEREMPLFNVFDFEAQRIPFFCDCRLPLPLTSPSSLRSKYETHFRLLSLNAGDVSNWSGLCVLFDALEVLFVLCRLSERKLVGQFTDNGARIMRAATLRFSNFVSCFTNYSANTSWHTPV